MFEKGDTVAWSHSEATKHAPGSIIYRSVIGEATEDPGSGQIGAIVAAANDEETIWTVDFDGEQRDLTADELVKVVPDPGTEA